MKIDRRVAIGTVLGGLAGAPLVVRALRAKYQKTIPDRSNEYEVKFKKGWAECMKQVALPAEQIHGPSSFTIGLNVPEARAYDVFVLQCVFPAGATVESLDPTVFPLWFSRVHARMQANRLEGKDALGLFVKADLYEVLGPTGDVAEFLRRQGMDTSPGEYVFVLNGNRMGEAKMLLSNGSTRAFQGGHVPPCCALLSTGLLAYSPDNTRLEVGAKWELPGGTYAEEALACQVAGFARVAGKDTAVISCDGNQSEVRSSHSTGVYVTGGNNTRIVRTAKSTCDLRMKAYLDLETGLPVRQELRKEARVQMPDATSSSTGPTYTVSCILDA